MPAAGGIPVPRADIAVDRPCLRGLPARWTIDSNSAARTAHRALGKDAPPGLGGRAVRGHCHHPDLVRVAPPIRPDMIFGKDRDWRRMRRCDDPSNDLGPLWSHQSYPDCIIATRGYDFREGQV
jgi:hypothetical protein